MIFDLLVEPVRDWLLSFGAFGAIVWIVLKILAIAVPVILTVAFYVVWERKLIGWMHVRHGPMYIGRGILQAFADVFKLLFKEVMQPTVAQPFLYRLGRSPAWRCSAWCWRRCTRSSSRKRVLPSSVWPRSPTRPQPRAL